MVKPKITLRRIVRLKTSGKVCKANKKEYIGSFWGSPSLTKKEWISKLKGRDIKPVFKERPKKKVFVNSDYC